MSAAGSWALGATSGDTAVGRGGDLGRGVVCGGLPPVLSRGAPRPVAGLSWRAHVGLPGAHDVVEPWPRHAPVLVLIRSHVVIVVPGQVLTGPLGVQVRALVDSVVVRRAVPHGRGVEGGEGKEGDVGERGSGEGRGAAPFGLPRTWDANVGSPEGVPRRPRDARGRRPQKGSTMCTAACAACTSRPMRRRRARSFAWPCTRNEFPTRERR